MSVWFTASAVAPELQDVWGLSTMEAGWLTTVVQLGFVVGTALLAVLNLADVIPARILFAASAVLACDLGALSEAPSESCSEAGAQCRLPAGPLGVCERSRCAAGAEPPCFQCTPQH